MTIKNLTRQVIRSCYPYGSIRRVYRGGARGMRFVVEPGMGFTYAMGAFGGGMNFLERYLRAGMTVFDIGANRGQMTLFFAHRVGASGKVVAFEPAPQVFSSLCRNIALNRLSHVHARCLAVADVEGKAEFLFSEEHCTQGKLVAVEKTYQSAGAERIEVTIGTLDAVGAELDVVPDLLKIDVEGAGAVVLRGARRLLERVSPAIFMELHGPEEQQGVKEELVARGYILETLDGTRVEDPTQGWYGTLWCYKSDAELTRRESPRR
jgi:FkbM family methyltransferase